MWAWGYVWMIVWRVGLLGPCTATYSGLFCLSMGLSSLGPCLQFSKYLLGVWSWCGLLDGSVLIVSHLADVLHDPFPLFRFLMSQLHISTVGVVREGYVVHSGFKLLNRSQIYTKCACLQNEPHQMLIVKSSSRTVTFIETHPTSYWAHRHLPFIADIATSIWG
jgi:hypothetical protein